MHQNNDEKSTNISFTEGLVVRGPVVNVVDFKPLGLTGRCGLESQQRLFYSFM
jgi:hypothetical protein